MTTTVAEASQRRSNSTQSAVAKFARVRAPFSLRCGAILIDYVLIVAIVALSTLISRMFGGGARSAGNSAETIGLAIAVVIAAMDLGVLPGLTGLTVGKWATGIRIQRVNGTDIGIGRAFLRHFVGYPLSLLLLGIGFLVAAFNARGRGLHDLIAGTVVVREGVVAVRPRP